MLRIIFSILLASVYSVTARAVAPTPNIVLIVVDDMGYADLGCYGSKAIPTPNIDRMATEGMRFTDAYSGCTVCAPARSTLMTGLHMGHTPVRGNTGGIPLPAETVTLSATLKQAGYAVGGFGKWGLGDLDTTGVPEKHGFDTFFGYYHQIHAHDYYPGYLIRNGEKVAQPGNGGKRGETYSHYAIVEATKQFIRNHAEGPFFCYAPWTPPHGKYQIPEDEPAWAMFQDKDWPRDARVAAAMDVMIDRHVGEVLGLLKEFGIDENTLVMFASDNGAAKRFDGFLDSSGPLRGNKRDMYEGGLRVPLVARWPGTIAPKQVVDHPTYFPDFFPTFVTLAGAPVPENLDGRSLVPMLTGVGNQPMHEALYWEWPTYDWSKRAYTDNGLMQAVRKGTWKLLRHTSDTTWELYDLSKDIGERHDVAAEHPDVVEELAAWIAANRTEMREQVEPEMPEGQKYR